MLEHERSERGKTFFNKPLWNPMGGKSSRSSPDLEEGKKGEKNMKGRKTFQKIKKSESDDGKQAKNC